MAGAGSSGAAPGHGAAASRWLRERPQLWVYSASLVCWGVLVLAPAGSAATAFCLGGDRFGGLSFAAGAALRDLDWPGALSHWLLMVGAMMLPMAAMAARHVAVRSFRRRRARAMAAFLLAYAVVWVAIGPLYLVAGILGRLAAGGGSLAPLVVSLAAAVAWQSAPAKRRSLRKCHRTVPLAPAGWRADRDCLSFGLAHGKSCLASCWALMLVPAVGGHHPLLMLVSGLIALGERRSPSAEPLRSPAAAWAGVAALLPALLPTGVRKSKALAGGAPAS